MSLASLRATKRVVKRASPATIRARARGTIDTIGIRHQNNKPTCTRARVYQYTIDALDLPFHPNADKPAVPKSSEGGLLAIVLMIQENTVLVLCIATRPVMKQC